MGPGRILGILLIALVSCLSVPTVAMAHPLGNFTVNHFARLQIVPDQIGVEYVVDMAEIPAFRALQKADSNHDRRTTDLELQTYLEQITPDYLKGLELQVDQHPITLQLQTRQISRPPGVGGLSTLRLEWQLTAKLPVKSDRSTHHLIFQNQNDRTRIGWREVVAQSGDGMQIFDSSVYRNSLTDALRTYPQDLLSTPLQESSATLFFTQGAIPATATALLNRPENIRLTPLETVSQTLKTTILPSGLQRLSPLPDLTWNTPTGLLLLLGAAFVWGAAHSLSPGHGKTIVGAYLVGTRATPCHALFLALTTTVTHTIGVFGLGFITLFASQTILPEQLYPWLSLLSGGLVVTIGIRLIYQRLRNAHSGIPDHAHDHPYGHHHGHHHDHHHNHHHGHHHDHSHAHSHPHFHLTPTSDFHSSEPALSDKNSFTNTPPLSIDWRGLLALGISGGLMPCPAALVLMLGAIAVGQTALGLALVFVFSLGLAGVLIGLGLLLVYARPRFKQLPASVSQWRRLPALSAAGIIVLGLGISLQALFELKGVTP